MADPLVTPPRKGDPFLPVDDSESELAYLLHHGQAGDERLLEALLKTYAGDVRQLLEILLAEDTPLLDFVTRGDSEFNENISHQQPSSDEPPTSHIHELLVQIFVSAVQQVEQFRGEASVRNWLFDIALQTGALFQTRRAVRVPRYGWKRPEALLRLRYVMGLKAGDIAAILRSSPIKVSKNLQKARARFMVGVGKPDFIPELSTRLSGKKPGSSSVVVRHVISLLHARLDGLLDDNLSAQASLDQHLLDCPTCQTYAGKLHEVDERLAYGAKQRFPRHDLTEEQVSGLVEEAKARLRLPRSQQTGRSPSLKLIRQASWIGLLGLIFLVASLYFMRLPAGHEFPLRPTSLWGSPAPTVLPTAIPLPDVASDTYSHKITVNYIFSNPAMSANGQRLAYSSLAFTQDATGMAVYPAIYVVDLGSGIRWKVSPPSQALNIDQIGLYGRPSLSADGRWLVYADMSYTNRENQACQNPTTPLLLTSSQSCLEIILVDLETGINQGSFAWQSITQGIYGSPANGDSFQPTISADGRWIAFWSEASNLTPDGLSLCDHDNLLATCPDLFIYDRETGEMTRIPVGADPDGNIQRYDRLGLSEDGRWLAFTIEGGDLLAAELDISRAREAVVFDRQTGAFELVNRAGDGTPGDDISFSPSISSDGRFVAFASASENLVRADYNNHTDIFIRDRYSDLLGRASITSDELMADADSGYAMGDWSYNALQVSADGRYVVFLSTADNLGQTLRGVCSQARSEVCNNLYFRDRRTGQTVLIGNSFNHTYWLDPSVSADGMWVTAVRYTWNCTAGGMPCSDVILYDRARGWARNLTNTAELQPELPWIYQNDLPGPVDSAYTLAFSDDGTLLAVADSDSQLHIWQEADAVRQVDELHQPVSELIYTYDPEGAFPVTSLDFSPDGELLAAGTMNGEVYIFSIPEQRRLFTLPNHLGMVKNLFFSADGSQLVVCTNIEISIWYHNQGRFTRLQQHSLYALRMNDADLEPSRNLLAVTTSDNTIWLLSLPGGEVLARLQGREFGISELAFSPDGTRLAVRSNSGTIDLWQVEWQANGRLTARVLENIPPSVWSGNLAFTPDGQYLASGSLMGTLWMWNLWDGTSLEIYPPAGNSWGVVSSVVFSPDGSRMAVAVQSQVALWQRREQPEGVLFSRAEVDAFLGAPPFPEASANDLPELGIPAASPENEHLTLYQADVHNQFDLMVPRRLPANVTFREARLTEDGAVLLSYDMEIPDGHAALYILEQFTGGDYRIMTVGASAQVENVLIEQLGFGLPISAEYVRGDWMRTRVFTPPQTPGGVGLAQDYWQWLTGSHSQRLRWMQDGMLFAIYYQVYPYYSSYSPFAFDALEVPGFLTRQLIEPHLVTPTLTGHSVGISASDAPVWLLSNELIRDDLVQIALGMDTLTAPVQPMVFSHDYLVMEGDTCTWIADLFGMTVVSLADLNDLPLSCNPIFPGQELQVVWRAEPQVLGEYDLDCNGQTERLLIVPMPNPQETSLLSGVILESLSDIGLYQEAWQVMITDSSNGHAFLSNLEVVTGDGCEQHLVLTQLGGESPGRYEYQWQEGEMLLVNYQP